jgi:hypothetical protein
MLNSSDNTSISSLLAFPSTGALLILIFIASSPQIPSIPAFDERGAALTLTITPSSVCVKYIFGYPFFGGRALIMLHPITGRKKEIQNPSFARPFLSPKILPISPLIDNTTIM